MTVWEGSSTHMHRDAVESAEPFSPLRNGMDVASWTSGAAADTRVDEVDDEELDDDVGPPAAPAGPHPGGQAPLDASMSTHAASSTGALPMSMSGPGARLAPLLACWK